MSVDVETEAPLIREAVSAGVAPQKKTADKRRRPKKNPKIVADSKVTKQAATQTIELTDEDSSDSQSEFSSDEGAMADGSESSSKEINVRGTRVAEWYLDIVGDVKMRAVIDSGASVSIMNWPTYELSLIHISEPTRPY